MIVYKYILLSYKCVYALVFFRISADVPCVVQDQQDSIVQVFRETARERGCPLTIAPIPEILEESAYGTKFRLNGVDY